MKVIVKFPDDVIGGEWVNEIIDRQDEHGFINVECRSDVCFILTEPGMHPYLISRDWIERIIEE
jgi:hypothetical protein